jgi:hypothetical protein
MKVFVVICHDRHVDDSIARTTTPCASADTGTSPRSRCARLLRTRRDRSSEREGRRRDHDPRRPQHRSDTRTYARPYSCDRQIAM